MADTIERIYKITVDAAAAVDALKSITAGAEENTKKLSEFTEKIETYGERLLEALAVKEFVSRILETADALDALGKEAQKVGIAAEDLQRLKYAADLSGVSTETLDKAVTKLSSTMATMGTATDETTRLLKLIGVSSGDSPVGALDKIADRFAKMPDGVEKTAEAVKLFGEKIGIQLIPLLNQGAEGIRKYTDEADRFGLVLSSSVLAAAGEFTDKLGLIKKESEATWAQMTTGLLPAMRALAEFFATLARNGELWRSVGAAIGEGLIVLAKVAIGASEVVRVFASDVEHLYAMLKAPIGDAGKIWKEWQDDLKKIDDQTNKAFGDLDAAFAKAKEGSEAAVKGTTDEQKALDALEKQKRAAEEAAKLAADIAHRNDEITKANYEAMIKLAKELNDEAGRAVNVQKMIKEAIDSSTKGFNQQAAATNTVGEAINKVTKEGQDYIKNQEDQQAHWDALRFVYEHSTGALKDYAQAQLALGVTVDASTQKIAEQSDEQKALGDGFNRFVDALSSGSVTVAQAFKGMAQSIIADLLKIWAKKYILDYLMAAFGGSAGGGGGAPAAAAGQAARGLAFDAGAILPFARGGVISRPVVTPLALMGEAGPEAVMPLKRGADGSLGVASSGAATMNVTIHNNAPGVDVSAQRVGPQDLQIIVERTRAAIAADIRTGGNPVASSFESTYALGRGSAGAR